MAGVAAWRVTRRRGPTDGVEQTGPPQLVGHGDGVGGLTGRAERGDGVEDVTVRRLVEVLRLEGLGGDGDGVLGEQHRPEERLLGLKVLRGDTPRAARGRWTVVVGEGHGAATLAHPGCVSLDGQPWDFRPTTLWTRCGQLSPGLWAETADAGQTDPCRTWAEVCPPPATVNPVQQRHPLWKSNTVIAGLAPPTERHLVP